MSVGGTLLGDFHLRWGEVRARRSPLQTWNQVEAARLLLQKDADAFTKNDDRHSALKSACLLPALQMSNMYFSCYSMEPQLPSTVKATEMEPVRHGSASCYVKLMGALLESGANPKI